MNDKDKKAFMIGWSAGWSTAAGGGDFTTENRERDWKIISKQENEKYYAIYSPRIKDAIGVCVGSELEHCLDEDPGCVGLEITKEQFDAFDDDVSITKNPKTGKAEVQVNGKIIGAQG